MIKKFGLTGGIGSGKSFVADHLKCLGANIIDADVIAREVVEPNTPALNTIKEHFGADILKPNGELDRTKLRTVIFNNPKEKLWLEGILHPLIRNEIDLRLAKSTPLYHMLVSPLLFETGQDALVSHVIVVDIPQTIQVSRSIIRDRSSELEIQRIIDSQMSTGKKLSRASYIIDNSGDKAATIEQVDVLHRKLLDL